jgi:hypothetical protein
LGTQSLDVGTLRQKLATSLPFLSYDMSGILGSLANQKISDHTDLSFLITRLRELSEEARKYLLWAAFFGET